MISRCREHPSENAIGKCSICNRPVCRKCSTIAQGKLTCRSCLHKKPSSRSDIDEEEKAREDRLERQKQRKG